MNIYNFVISLESFTSIPFSRPMFAKGTLLFANSLKTHTDLIHLIATMYAVQLILGELNNLGNF